MSLTVVSRNRTLPRTEGVEFCPAQANPQAQHALSRNDVLGARIVRDIQPRNADRAARAGQRH